MLVLMLLLVLVLVVDLDLVLALHPKLITKLNAITKVIKLGKDIDDINVNKLGGKGGGVMPGIHPGGCAGRHNILPGLDCGRGAGGMGHGRRDTWGCLVQAAAVMATTGAKGRGATVRLRTRASISPASVSI